jgi:hypothetical protein
VRIQTVLPSNTHSFNYHLEEEDLVPITPEASALPVSDKPVTLSFGKAGGSTTTKLSLVAGKKAAPVTIGFNLAEDAGAEEDDEEDPQSIDPSTAKRTSFDLVSQRLLTLFPQSLPRGRLHQ